MAAWGGRPQILESRLGQVGLAFGLLTVPVEPVLGLLAGVVPLALAAFYRRRTGSEPQSPPVPRPVSPHPPTVNEGLPAIPRKHRSPPAAAPEHAMTGSRVASDLEARLAAALETAEFVQSLEAEISEDRMATIPPENPAVRDGMLSTTPDDLHGEAEFEEAAVAAAYIALRAEIADRLEALERKEGQVHDRAKALATEGDAITAFRARVAESIEVLTRHRARLEEIRQSLASWHEPRRE